MIAQNLLQKIWPFSFFDILHSTKVFDQEISAWTGNFRTLCWICAGIFVIGSGLVYYFSMHHRFQGH